MAKPVYSNTLDVLTLWKPGPIPIASRRKPGEESSTTVMRRSLAREKSGVRETPSPAPLKGMTGMSAFPIAVEHTKSGLGWRESVHYSKCRAKRF
jgi:hypothetical protein